MLRTVFAMAVAGLVFGAVSGTAQAAVAALIALAIRQIVFRPRAQFALSSKLDLLSVVVAPLIGGLAGHELAT
jgi:hypothetical protein